MAHQLFSRYVVHVPYVSAKPGVSVHGPGPVVDENPLVTAADQPAAAYVCVVGPM